MLICDLTGRLSHRLMWLSKSRRSDVHGVSKGARGVATAGQGLTAG